MERAIVAIIILAAVLYLARLLLPAGLQARLLGRAAPTATGCGSCPAARSDATQAPQHRSP